MFNDLNRQQMQDAAGMNELRKAKRSEWPDRLSGWTLPPPSARAVGEVEPVRVFESAEAAMAFMSGLQARVTHGVVRFEPCAPFELTPPQSGALHRVACGLTPPAREKPQPTKNQVSSAHRPDELPPPPGQAS